jgi:HTH-type transcriptional regulator, sugar sensing transcriptional regulator
MSARECRESLRAFGFTELEADVYAFLLGESPATGYRVAQAIGKPVANTYKAVQTLQAKDAVVAEDGDGRLCRAVPAEELLDQLERRFRDSRRRASRALSRVRSNPEDHRVYQLRTPARVFERCRRILADCRHVAIIDAFPRTLDELRPAIEKSAGRGVTVAVQAYRAAIVAGADVVVRRDGEAVMRRWPGQWLNLVADGREYVLALLTEDLQAVHQAVWSRSAYLAWVYSSAVAAEVVLSEIARLNEDGASIRVLRRALRRHSALCRPDLPGYRELVRRFGGLNGADSPVPQQPKNSKRKTGAS